MFFAGELQEEQKETEVIVKKPKPFKGNAENGTVTEDDIAMVILQWTKKIRVKKFTKEEFKQLAKLENQLHKRVIGQDEAVTAVAKAIKRGRSRIKRSEAPHWFFPFIFSIPV